ncbi:FAD-binding domain-containing protein [Mycena floridula]|nr:FAD-binding domain-containing protein [Mycena floridula]
MLSVSVCLLAFGLAKSLASPLLSAENIASFNASLNGRLQIGVPFARPCFNATAPNVAGVQDKAECQEVITGYLDHNERLANFGGYMNVEWEMCQATGEGCLLDLSNTSSVAQGICQQGSVPPLYIEIESAADVQKAFAFSKSTGINLVVKNTGHDYAGRSAGPGTLALWTHGLQSVNFTEKFVTSGCKADPIPAVTVGSGVTHGTMYQLSEQLNITLPGGGDATVGAVGGYLQGGGHSALTNAFGLAVDRVLEIEVVTPDGQVLTANKCQNTDLFFALRGGGGVFGVVLKVTMKALPKFTMTTAQATFATNLTTQAAAFMVNNTLSYMDQGWSGYIAPGSVILTTPLQTVDQASKSTATLKAFIESIGGTMTLTSDPSYPAFFNRVLAPVGVPVGLSFVTSSRLISTSLFKTTVGRSSLVQGLSKVFAVPDTSTIVFMVAPHFFKDDGGTSVTDAWRTSLWHVTTSTVLPSSGGVPIYQKLHTTMDILRKVSPDSGAYINESDVYEPDFTKSFWGKNYDRLVSLKRKYDPNHLLDCWRCVDWKGANDPRYKCYAKI